MGTELHEALHRLPPAYAAAWRLRAAGADVDETAARLDIDRDAVQALLRLADAKLAAEMTPTGDTADAS